MKLTDLYTMPKLLSKKETEQLLQLGFEASYPDNEEPDYCEYHLHIQHPLLKNLHIVIEDNIYVYCDAAKGGLFKGKVLIVRKKFSLNALRKALEVFLRS